MYSLVLMVAMTSAPEAPNCGHACGCYGGGYGGCYGSCYGGGYGGCYGCGGCYGGGYGAGYGGGYGGGGYTYTPAVWGAYTYGIPATATVTPSAESRAVLEVRMPEGSKLLVDSHPIDSSGGIRRFSTPALEKDKRYTYLVTGVQMVNNKEVKTEKRVIVRAGETTVVSLEFPQERPTIASVDK